MQAKPHPVDIYVGSRLRQRRTALGISPPKLAATLGIAYQQLYKYEQAKNRISASRLYEFSKTLRVPVAFFFEGIAETETTTQKPRRRPNTPSRARKSAHSQS